MLFVARQCPLLDTASHHGRLKCSHPNSAFSYGSHCNLECSEGFWFRGNSTVICKSSGLWSRKLPTCRRECPSSPCDHKFWLDHFELIKLFHFLLLAAVQCEVIGALSLPLSMNCSHPLANFSFGSNCVFTCGDGFSLNGTAALLCTSTGFWSSHVPSCIGRSVDTNYKLCKIWYAFLSKSVHFCLIFTLLPSASLHSGICKEKTKQNRNKQWLNNNENKREKTCADLNLYVIVHKACPLELRSCCTLVMGLSQLLLYFSW